MALRADILADIDAALDAQALRDADEVSWSLIAEKIGGPAHRITIASDQGFVFEFGPQIGNVPTGEGVDVLVTEFLSNVIEELSTRRLARRGA